MLCVRAPDGNNRVKEHDPPYHAAFCAAAVQPCRGVRINRGHDQRPQHNEDEDPDVLVSQCISKRVKESYRAAIEPGNAVCRRVDSQILTDRIVHIPIGAEGVIRNHPGQPAR